MLLDEIKVERSNSYTREIIGATVITILLFATILGIILVIVLKMKAKGLVKTNNYELNNGLNNTSYEGNFTFTLI